MRARVWARALLALGALLLAGCFPPFTTPKNAFYGPCYGDATRPEDLAVLEIDSAGELQNPGCQLDALIEDLPQLAADRGLLTVVFVHGWRNSADANSAHAGNLRGFREILGQLQELEKRRAGENGRRVLGIFVGWRGTTLKTAWWNIWDFHNRKWAAERVARGALPDALYRICSRTQAEGRDSRCIVTGHSLGGLIVERSVGEVLRASVLAHATQGDAAGESERGPFDLVVALNPANEAMWAKLFIDTLHEAGDAVDPRLPIFVSITSAADNVTKNKFYGARRWWSTLMKRGALRFCGPDEEPTEGRICQKDLFERTAGHLEALRSHELDFRKECSSDPTPACDLESEACYRWTTPAGECFEYEIRGWEGRTYNHTAYWLIWDSGDLIESHSDIFTPELVGLLAGLLQNYALADR